MVTSSKDGDLACVASTCNPLVLIASAWETPPVVVEGDGLWLLIAVPGPVELVASGTASDKARKMREGAARAAREAIEFGRRASSSSSWSPRWVDGAAVGK